MQKNAKFGVAGMPVNYTGKVDGFFDWLNELGLNAYEIQCTYGFKMSDELIEYCKTKSDEKGIAISMHAPYYVNMGSLKEDVALKSKFSLMGGITLAQKANCKRIIFHPGGGYGKTEEERAVAIDKIIDACNYIAENTDMQDVKLYPEIAGKTINLGTLDEIITICKNCSICYPCIDIAHLHARNNGCLYTKDDFRALISKLQNELSKEKFENLHFHAYAILHSDKGEIRHLMHGENYADGSAGLPNLNDFIDVLKEFEITPYIISEARASQELGAKFMRDYYYGKKTF